MDNISKQNQECVHSDRVTLTLNEENDSWFFYEDSLKYLVRNVFMGMVSTQAAYIYSVQPPPQYELPWLMHKLIKT